MAWTDAQLDHIAECLEGRAMTAAQIARSVNRWFDVTVTRNAVVGIVTRNKRLAAIGFTPKSPPGVARRGAGAARAAAKPAWTDAQLDHIAECLEGRAMTAAQIARSVNRWFDVTVTRNAVVGIVTRNKRLAAIGFTPKSPPGVARRGAGAARAAAKPAWTSKKQVAVRADDHPPRRDLDAVIRQPPVKCDPPPALVETAPLPMIALEARQCRFPIGHDQNGHLFCAAPVSAWAPGKPGGSYCAHHRALARGAGTRAERTALKTARTIGKTDWQ